MATEPQAQMLEGTLERFTYQNEENGYTVARLVPQGRSYEVTVVGTLAGVNVGESLRLKGTWTTHPRYGRQFEVSSYTVELPATAEGIRKYLGSGLVKGVGPVTAKRIVDYFGLETLDVIEEEVRRLREIPGVGPKRAGQIAKAWETQKQIKDIMLFLQSHGVSSGLAVKIYKQYGDAAIQVVRTAPYQLARDIYGIGFKTADKIAMQMGMAVDAPERIQAGIRYALGTYSDEGHCYADRNALLATAAELLEVDVTACEPELDALRQQEEIIEVETASTFTGKAIYLPPFYYAEQGVASKLRQLRESERDRLALFHDIDWDVAFTWLKNRHPIRLTPAQQAAIRMALTERVSILTGGPGTGKSTIMGSLIELLRAKQQHVLLAAPTGRAAKRLSETTGLPAKTIHRLLEFKPGRGNAFLRDRENPLDTDLVIVDEASMIDILLMNHLLKAIEAGTHLLLVGDIDQLPSVGPGNVLHDLIHSEVLPVTRLETIFRQAEDSYIVVNAHRINRGEMPLFPKDAADFYLFRQPEPEKASSLIIDIVARRIPQKFGYAAATDIQVLTPMHRGECGVTALNRRLQKRLNPPVEAKPEVQHGSRTFREGDRVMQIRNDYERQVFNGDMGTITDIDLEAHLVTIDFDDLEARYELSELDNLVHAYAISIHKSQGSEFPAVVVPILTQHYVMLQRNLLYTAVTRGRELVVLVGDHRAIAIAVRNDRIAHRNTRLQERLMEGAGPQQASGGYAL
ncbi:MAG: SF1B family DNA helicase RecD2 [Anaerolineae bacterium]